MDSSQWPALVVAADWSAHENKRWMVRAERPGDGDYLVFPPEPVGDVRLLIPHLHDQAAGRPVVVGFDFPIGLPASYARPAGIRSFRKALQDLPADFYEVTDSPSINQPFYPATSRRRGEYGRRLAEALSVNSLADLLRRCDRKTAKRPAAACLFFTIGAQQVGKAAIVGWREAFWPQMHLLSLWPFEGEFDKLLKRNKVVVVEIYPRQAAIHLGLPIGKIRKGDRAQRRGLRDWLLTMELDGVRFSDAARSWIEWGFLSDDDFDAMLGLLGMLQTITSGQPIAAPEDREIKKVEGWIFGQPVDS